jgi:hypothetical protein
MLRALCVAEEGVIVGETRTTPAGRHRRWERYVVIVLAAALVSFAAATAPVARAITEFSAATYGVGANARAVAAADLNGDGITDVVAADAGSDAVSVLLGTGDGALAPATTFAAGTQPADVAIADLNKDGKPDIVTADSGGSTVSVLLGHGDGTFGAATHYTTGGGPRAVTVRDLNGDGLPDIVTANQTANTVSVLLADGQGGFAAHVDYAVGAMPYDVAAGDLNGDGQPDLAAVNNVDGTFSVLLNAGDGTFGHATAFPVAADQYAAMNPVALCITDVDRDGTPDVVSCTSNYGYVSVSKGSGAGSFIAGVGWFSGAYGSGLAVADFNRDGVMDFATAASTLNVRLGAADGRMYALQPTSVGTPAPAGAVAVTVADMDKDGLPDIITADGTGDQVSVLRNTGSHTFWAIADCDITGQQPIKPMALATADLNQDGKPDVIAGMGASIQVALGSGNGMFASGDLTMPLGSAVASYPCGDGYDTTYSIVTGDFTGDGHQDVVAAFGQGIVLLPGDGAGHLGAPSVAYRGDFTGEPRLAAGDVNNDGKLDLVATPTTSAPGALVFLGSGGGSFAAPTTVAAVNGAPFSVIAGPLTLADLNDDGNRDIVVGGGGKLDVALGRGDGTFNTAAAYSAGTFSGSPVNFPEFVLAGDFTGDGKTDVMMTSDGGKVSLLVGNGDGTLGNLTQVPACAPLPGFSGTCGPPVAADFNGDGKLDLALLPNGSGAVGLLLNTGGGSFAQCWENALTGQPVGYAVTAADFNGDGRQDVALVEGLNLHVLLNSGHVPVAAAFAVDGGADKAASLTLAIDGTALNAAQMRFSTDGTTWTDWMPYTVHTIVTATPGDGGRVITGQFRNASGDVTTFAQTITMDTTPPRLSYGWAPGWCKDYQNLWFSSSDAGSGVTSGAAKIEYRVGTGGWTTLTKKNYVALTVYGYGYDQIVPLDIRLTDALGNQSAITELPLRIDGAPPVTTETGADNGWHRDDVTVTFSATDGGIGVASTQYSLDGGGIWTSGTSVTIYAQSAVGHVGGDGVHTISYRSTDAFGHVEQAKTCTVKINSTDSTPPSASVSGADAAWHNKPVTLTFTGTDPDTGVAGYEYSVDGGSTWQPGGSAVISTPGVTTVQYRATDGVGNVSAPQSCVIKLDLTVPKAAAPAAASVKRYRTAALKYAVADLAGQSPDAVTIKITNAHGRVVRTATVSGVRLNVTLAYKFRCTLARGTYKFSVSACDGAGNRRAKAVGNKLVVR